MTCLSHHRKRFTDQLSPVYSELWWVFRVLFSEYNVIWSNLIKLARIKYFRVLIKIAHSSLSPSPLVTDARINSEKCKHFKGKTIMFTFAVAVVIVVVENDKKRKWSETDMNVSN